ncbi:type II toxin-antitoxin system RelE/ParE family toxin [Neisseria sp. ZJ106]|uniref:Type II toxin-antitoxin system RelE/ParE family toxin n=1 Tax=Neisseria lisongii TaxID=2912188 RepID=A0ABY7RM82_9NEIS|nr:type II toxin-antitoxin system RelE/ParE family toxin [Neisseria lisongii]MCF7521430.1 type II toxin-antitoxin system RelE/ParE family toxin [Neisseria lisongii]WCL72428.1 type II toxin-antitoxin system RelE/ParE family toxin [Neisseria lisongii]
MRIFKNKFITKFARKQGISDQELKETVARAESGLVDADLGGGVIKQRIARKGQGKSGGYRSIILFKCGDKAFFVYGFAKSERENISHAELMEFKTFAATYLNVSSIQLDRLVELGIFTEITP